jgi:outer membrane receptor for ferrienterochelin and colicins
VRVTVVHDSVPVPGALVRALDLPSPIGAQSNERGTATLRLPPGDRRLVVGRLGFRPDTLTLSLRAGQDTAVVARLEEQGAELETIVVAATRGERRVEDTPLRVEVIDEEEIAEKVAMTPGDIAMMLNETSGLRVQTTNPSLGGANVRMQGLRGRYSLMLADGLPLYGGQAGGLGLLQVPPVDLGRVEVIKGTASALYGSSALGGVINLVSRRPGEERETTALINQTTRGGTDGVFMDAGPLSERWGYTLLAGGHLQRRQDIDDDGWTDMPGYERGVLRPRLFYDDGAGRTAFLTAGFTAEQRDGGTMDGGTVPGGGGYVEALGTRRADLGALARWVFGDAAASGGAILTVRGSGMEQRHDHEFGAVREDDRHRTWFGEAALALPRSHGSRTVTWILGAAFQQDVYRNASVDGFDYTYAIPSAFAQADVDAASWLSLSGSARLDSHSEFGTFVNPRVSLLLRRPAEGAFAGWTTRLSAGTGDFAPTPFTEETEATGLTPVVLPAGGLAALSAEGASSASLDVGGPLETAVGRLELNLTAFGSRVGDPLQVRDTSGTTADGASRIALVNAPGPVRTWGGELLARLVYELGEAREVEGAGGEEHAEPPTLRITGSYTYLRSTECDPDAASGVGCVGREVPLTPRHAAGLVASVEQHGRSRVGLEVYYTGRQELDDNPYRSESKPYVIVGLLGERAFRVKAGVARVFLNLENLTNVRQTRHDPLLLPARGSGGRWTTDAWTDLAGFTVNGGVRLGF